MSSDVPDQFVNYQLCKELGWTYEQLMSQPSEVIEQFIAIIGITKKIANKHGQ